MPFIAYTRNYNGRISAVGDADVDTMLNNGKQRLAADLVDRAEILAESGPPTVLDDEVENAPDTQLLRYLCA
jgi:hypothetical protein